MNELHDMLRGASEAAGRGASADAGDRAELRRRVGAARRRSTMGSVAAALAGVLAVGATTMAIASGGSRDVPPASTTPSSSATSRADASVGTETWHLGDIGLTGDPVLMPLAGGDGVLELTTWSTEQFEQLGVEGYDYADRPVLDPVAAEDLAGYGEGWAFVEDELTDDQGAATESVLLLAAPDGTAVPVADLAAIADGLGIGGGLFVADIAGSADAPEVLVSLEGEGGAFLVWMDLASGTTWVMTLGDSVRASAISWRGGSDWMVWGYADGTPLAMVLGAQVDGLTWTVNHAWVPWAADTRDFGGLVTGSGLVTAYLGDSSLLVARSDDGRDEAYLVDRLWGVIGRSGDCYLVDLADGIGCVDVPTGEVSAPDDLPEPSGGSGLAALGDGYLEGPAVESGGSTAVWHRPDGDTEITIDADASVGYGGLGEHVWLDQDAVGVIGTDGVYRGVDLPLDDGSRAHGAYAHPVG
ncbi:hypothetical protein [Demequina subtropica]|uniref:hypothetical protein n=1 Tax=Demequina subtropica TaxID=1638989 RepID=UPI0007855B4D|nr:hypothetical protein [Demequina subtropica]